MNRRICVSLILIFGIVICASAYGDEDQPEEGETEAPAEPTVLKIGE